MMDVMVRHPRANLRSRLLSQLLRGLFSVCLVFLVVAAGGWAQPATTPLEPQKGLDRVKAGGQEVGRRSVGIGEGFREVADDVRKAWLEDGQIKVVVVEADGAVDDFMRDSIERRIETAHNLGAEVIVLQIDTYGGLVTAALDISRFIKQQDDVHIVCFVENRAISAGAMIALACDEIVMEHASMIGDSGVISVGASGGMEPMGPTERAKAESPVLADFDDSARRNDYSPLLAAAFVATDRAVYYIENLETQERRFVGPAEYEQLVNGGRVSQEETDWQPVPDVPVPLDGPDTLLTLGAPTAEAIGLSTGTYRNVNDFAADRGVEVAAVLSPGWGERLVGFFSGMAVRGILMTVLFFGIYMSLSAPGTGAPEAVTVFAAALLFGVPWLTGFAEWYEVLLVMLGVGLLAVELFIIPGFGVAGITGLIAIVLGLALTFVGPLTAPGLPVGFGVDWSRFGYGLMTTLLGLIASILLWVWLSRFLPKLPFANRLILQDIEPSPEDAAAIAAHRAPWPEAGMIGWAVSDLRPGGTAKFSITPDPDDTANADVVSDRGFIPAGTKLAVVEVAGNRVIVRPTEGEG